MAITFDTKYPTALKNAAWQKSKSLKDKSKAKSGLGELLTVAEKDWRKLEFDLLIAAKQNLTGKNLAQLQAARKEADDYLKGPIVTKAIASLEAAASKAKSTGKNTSLSATAAKAAAALSGALLAQAKLLHAIKLNDFQEGVARAGQTVTQMEHDHTEALKTMDTIRDALKSSKDSQTWQESDVGTVIANAVNITKTLADETDDKNWRDNHERWKRLQISYAATDRRVNSLPHSRVAEEIETFADLMQGALGGMWH